MKDTLIPSFSCTLNADSPVADSILLLQQESTHLFPSTEQACKEEKDDGKMTRKRKRSEPNSNQSQNQIKTVTEFKVDNCEEQEGTQPEYDSFEKYIEHDVSSSAHIKPLSNSHFPLSSEYHKPDLLQPNPDLRTNSNPYTLKSQAPLNSPLSSRMRHSQRPVIQNSNLIQCSQSLSTKSPPTCQVQLTDTVTIDMNDAQNQDSKLSIFKLYITLTCFFVVVISCGLFASALPRLVRPRVTESYPILEEEDNVLQEDGLDKFTTGRTLRALKKEVGMVVMFDEIEQAVPISIDDVYLDEIRSIAGDRT